MILERCTCYSSNLGKGGLGGLQYSVELTCLFVKRRTQVQLNKKIAWIHCGNVSRKKLYFLLRIRYRPVEYPTITFFQMRQVDRSNDVKWCRLQSMGTLDLLLLLPSTISFLRLPTSLPTSRPPPPTSFRFTGTLATFRLRFLLGLGKSNMYCGTGHPDDRRTFPMVRRWG